MYAQIDGILTCRDLSSAGRGDFRRAYVPLHGSYVLQLWPHVPKLEPLLHVDYYGDGQQVNR